MMSQLDARDSVAIHLIYANIACRLGCTWGMSVLYVPSGAMGWTVGRAGAIYARE